MNKYCARGPIWLFGLLLVLGCLPATPAFCQSNFSRDLVRNGVQLHEHANQLAEIAQKLQDISWRTPDAEMRGLVVVGFMRVEFALVTVGFAAEFVGAARFIGHGQRTTYYPHLTEILDNARRYTSGAMPMINEARGKIREPETVRLLNRAASVILASVKLIDRSAAIIRANTP